MLNCPLISQGLFDFFVLRSRDYPSISFEIQWKNGEKFTLDEMRHTTRRMCLSSSRAHFSVFQLWCGSKVGSEKWLSRRGSQHADSSSFSGTFCGDDFSDMKASLLGPIYVNMSFPLFFAWLPTQQCVCVSRENAQSQRIFGMGDRTSSTFSGHKAHTWKMCKREKGKSVVRLPIFHNKI